LFVLSKCSYRETGNAVTCLHWSKKSMADSRPTLKKFQDHISSKIKHDAVIPNSVIHSLSSVLSLVCIWLIFLDLVSYTFLTFFSFSLLLSFIPGKSSKICQFSFPFWYIGIQDTKFTFPYKS